MFYSIILFHILLYLLGIFINYKCNTIVFPTTIIYNFNHDSLLYSCIYTVETQVSALCVSAFSRIQECPARLIITPIIIHVSTLPKKRTISLSPIKIGYSGFYCNCNSHYFIYICVSFAFTTVSSSFSKSS